MISCRLSNPETYLVNVVLATAVADILADNLPSIDAALMSDVLVD